MKNPAIVALESALCHAEKHRDSRLEQIRDMEAEIYKKRREITDQISLIDGVKGLLNKALNEVQTLKSSIRILERS